MKTKIILILVLGAFLMAAPGCSLLKKRVEKKEKVTYKLDSKNKNTFSLDNVNGEIKVVRTNDTSGIVTIEAEKISKVKADDLDKPLDNVQVKIDTAGNEITVKTEYKTHESGLFNKNNDGRVNYEIKVPANLKVNIGNVNGAIVLNGIGNDIKVETTNGSVNMTRCTGNITVEGTNGSVYCNLDTVKSVNIDVTNGAIKLGGLKNASANLSATTVNGRVKYSNIDFSNLSAEKKSLTGTIGTGSNLIKLNTVNGSITLEGNEIAMKKDKHDEFNFEFNFDDDDHDVHTKKKDTAKSLDAPKSQDSSKTSEAPKAK